MINYILHVSLLLGIGFILYQVLLKKETFYSLNRIILFSYLVLAFVLPSIHIPSNWSLKNEVATFSTLTKKGPIEIEKQTESALSEINTDNGGSITEEDKNNNNESVILPGKENKIPLNALNEASTIDKTSTNPIIKSSNLLVKWPTIIKWIYIVGLAIFLINFLVQFAILIYYRIKYPTLKDGKMTIVEMPGDKAPFSFLNMIYINPTKYDYDTYAQILAHEKIHITKWHSADIFLSELSLIFLWFNPFAWHYRKAVEHNLEYLTDQEMLASGANAEVYQMNLLKVSVPELPLALSTNYNQSFLKKRIQMMNAKKSSAQSTWKYLCILPILVLSVAMMNPTYAVTQINNDQNTEKSTEFDTKKKETEPNKQLTFTPEVINTHTTDPINPQLDLIDPIIDSNIQLNLGSVTLGNDIKVLDTEIGFDLMHDLSDLGLDTEEGISVRGVDDKLIMTTNSGKSYTLDYNADRTIIKGSKVDIETKGIWEAEINGSQVCFFIKKGGIGKNYFWSSTECMKTSEFSPEIKPGVEGEFKLVREAGTMVLKGEFEVNDGTGRYSFQPDASYISYIKSQGYEVKEKKIIHFFLSNINKDYFNFLKTEGYTKLDDEELIAMAIHGVDKEYIKDINGEFRKVNYKKPSAEELISMKIHDVDMEYIKSFGKELYEDLSVDQIIAAAIHDVNPSYISQFKEMGYEDLTFDNLISASIHDVNIDYIKELRSAGYNDLSFDNLISASIHNLDPKYIEKFKNAGFENLNFDQMVSAAIHNVNPDYIKAFETAGFKNISFDNLISASIHNVDIKFIKSFENAGFDNLNFDDIISASIHGVDVDYLKKAQSYGFDLSFDQLISAGIHNVDLKYIEAFSNAGMVGLTFDNMITAAIHNIDPEMITDFQSMGFDDMSFDDLTTAAIHNVNPGFIKGIKDAGFTDITFDDIVSFKIHNIDLDDIKGLKDLGFNLDTDDMITAGIHNVSPRFINKMKEKGFKDLTFDEYVKLKIHGF
ncbi:MAG: hypothetical protein ACJA1A_000004 [Saprospiraceae bacterium]|jgi:hypothetical protein